MRRTAAAAPGGSRGTACGALLLLPLLLNNQQLQSMQAGLQVISNNLVSEVSAAAYALWVALCALCDG
jgi:hypothetical protein